MYVNSEHNHNKYIHIYTVYLELLTFSSCTQPNFLAPKHDPLLQLQQKTHHFTPVFAGIPGCSPRYCPNSASMPPRVFEI